MIYTGKLNGIILIRIPPFGDVQMGVIYFCLIEEVNVFVLFFINTCIKHRLVIVLNLWST